MMWQDKASIFDTEAVEAFRKEHKIEPYRIKQIYDAIFKQSLIDFTEITTIAKDLRELFDQHFHIIPLREVKLVEDDETSKFLFETSDGQVLESVLMYHFHQKREEMTFNNVYQVEDADEDALELNRMTLCISSQVGCAVGCIFCVTGKMKLKKNLHWTEILGQVLYINNFIKTKLGKKQDGTLHKVRNIVFMGMGEPMMNYPNVKKTIEFLTDTKYLGLSRKRVTVSTSGLLKPLREFIADNLPVALAFSLHAPNQTLREELIPLMAHVNPLDQLMELMDQYTEQTGNKVFFEYVMIKNKNDSKEIAHQLGKLLQHRNAHLNMIPYNENPAIDLEESTPEAIKKFRDIVESYKVTVTVRENRGRKAKSACGQLGWEKVVQMGK